MNPAVGADQISYRIIKALATVHKQMLPNLFSNLLKIGAFPDTWKVAKCIPIPKPGKSDLSYPKSHRPILLLSCLGKTFEKILAARVTEAAEITGILTHREFGPRLRHLAIDALMVTVTPAQDMLTHNNTQHVKVNRPTIMTNDVEGAFNCVLHQKLTDILEHFGIPSSLVRTITDFNTGRKMT